MIVYEEPGDILNCSAQTLVCPVNTYGVMGCGLALAFKNRYPGLNEAYRKACRDRVFKEKGIFVFDFSPTRKILCFPTKRDWRDPSHLLWIDKGLEAIARDFALYHITSLAVPAIGCGYGGLSWKDVSPIIDYYLDPIDLKVGVFPPN